MQRIIIVALFLLTAQVAMASGSYSDYTVGGESFQGYFISAGEDAPLVVIVHDWDGLTDYEVKRAHMLAELGYSAFALDLFGKGVRPTETEEKRKLTGMLYGDRDRMRALLEGGLREAAARGGNLDNSVIIGYCFGGASVLELARSGADLKAFVAFHGGLTTPENQNYQLVKGKILIFHGTADTAVTMDQFATLAKDLEEAGVYHEMTTYSGAPHAFTVIGSPRYHEDADRKSWQRFTRFLAENL